MLLGRGGQRNIVGKVGSGYPVFVDTADVEGP